MAPPIAAIVGPTASGKTELALTLARELPIEILVADSRQVYRGMDVGTAKPDAATWAAVPHHLLDLVAPGEPFTVADWVARARELIPLIAGRGRLPLVVGGTGLYVSALVDGYDLAGEPGTDGVRKRLAADVASEGLPAMAARLTRLDPGVATRTDMRNPRRVLRALERLGGRGGGVVPTATPYPGQVRLLGVSRPRETLDARIRARATAMFAGGLLDEVRGLLAAGAEPEMEQMSGHGYREAARVLAGEWGIEEAIEVTVLHTRQYAKRQMTWFRRYPQIVWLDAGDGPADAPDVVERALELIRPAAG